MLYLKSIKHWKQFYHQEVKLQEKVTVPVSRFAAFMGYCQIGIVNHYELKLERVVSPEAKLGKKVHSDLEERDKLVPRKKATKEELKDPKVALDITRESLRILIQRENKNRFSYLGRIDKVVRADGALYIIDDKITKSGKTWRQPFLDKRIQLAAYCEGFVLTYPDIAFDEIVYKVVQRDQKGEILKEFDQPYDSEQRNFLIGNFETFEGIYNGDIDPMHCGNPNKCRACGYKDCQHKLD